MTWIYKVGLQGFGSRDKRTLSFKLASDHATLDLAVADAGTIQSSLAAITKAFIRSEKLIYSISDDNQRPTDASADTYEEAAVVCYLNAQADLEKLHTVGVPAPEDSIFLSDGQTLDPGNALVQAYIGDIEDLVALSDDEQLNGDGRTNEAVKHGWLRSKARSFSPTT